MSDQAQPRGTSSAPYRARAASYEKAIDHPTDPGRNHPIHDAALVTEYAGGRYVVALALDGVSESKSADRLVPISGTLRRAFAQFCQETSPADMRAVVDWFRQTTRESRYSGLGATTVCLVRFDRHQGIIDGINFGDSVPLMVVDRPGPPPMRGGAPGAAPRASLQRRAAVLAPLHSVANDPSAVYQCWRAGHPFNPDGFRLAMPVRFQTVWLVAMSDGFSKITAEAAHRIMNLRRVEKILARRYADFVRVYLPAPLVHLAPGVRRPRNGRVRYSAIQDNAALKQAFADYYKNQADRKERRAMEGVDLDTNFLQALVQHRDHPNHAVLGKTVGERLAKDHRTLRWLARAPLNPAASDRGLEEHLRQYVVAELFAEAMVSHLAAGAPLPPPRPPSPPPPPPPATLRTGGPPPIPPTPSARRTGEASLEALLGEFVDGLGQVGDDLCAAVIRIRRT